MRRDDFKRVDGRYLDFEDITEGSVILVQEKYDYGDVYFPPFARFLPGDIWVVEALANRPRVAIIRNLQRGERSGLRVDELLRLDDKDILTIGPG